MNIPKLLAVLCWLLSSAFTINCAIFLARALS
jgi:hypothetical protein